MHKYLKIQEAPVTDSITDDGHVGARLPWPVLADAEGIVHIPSSRLGMVRIAGFQRDLAVMRVDLWWQDAFADPSKAVGMYLVAHHKNGSMGVSLSAVDTAEIQEHVAPLPID